MKALEAYSELLWSQFQYDWSVFSTPWVFYTVIPWLLYFIVFVIKWYVLLIPITLPCSVLGGHFKVNDDTELQEPTLEELKSLLRRAEMEKVEMAKIESEINQAMAEAAFSGKLPSNSKRNKNA